jgi:7-cyano-7-deazaguanine synthase
MRVLILYSGGTDSRLMLKMAKRDGLEPVLLFVDYGQTHDPEPPEEALKVSISGLALYYKPYPYVASDYIPARNLMLIAVASAIAEQEGIGTIWLGANQSDIDNLYPDCHPLWIKAVSGVLAGNIRVVAPLQRMTQEEVIEALDDNASR